MGGIVGAVAAPLIGSALGGIFGGPSGQQQGSPQQIADPFASQRPQYQTALNNLTTGGSSAIASDPSYQFRLQQGMDATNRGLAQSGQTGSGAQVAQLAQYGQGMASTEYANQFSRLASLSGANINGTGAAAGIAQQNQQQQNMGFGQIGNALAGGVGNMFSGPSMAQTGAQDFTAGWNPSNYG